MERNDRDAALTTPRPPPPPPPPPPKRSTTEVIDLVSPPSTATRPAEAEKAIPVIDLTGDDDDDDDEPAGPAWCNDGSLRPPSLRVENTALTSAPSSVSLARPSMFAAATTTRAQQRLPDIKHWSVRPCFSQLPSLGQRAAPPPQPASAPLATPSDPSPPRADGLLQGRSLSPGPQWQDIYTDASVRQPFGGVGVSYPLNGSWHGCALAVVPENRQKNLKSSDVEMLAMCEGLRVARLQILSHERLDSVRLYSDCQGGIETLKRTRFSGKRVDEFVQDAARELEALETLGAKVELKWVRGHSGVLGNHLADRLAAYGASQAKDGAAHGKSWSWFDKPLPLSRSGRELDILRGGERSLRSEMDTDERRAQKVKLRKAEYRARLVKENSSQ